MVWNPFAAFWPNSSILPDTCEHIVRLGMLCYMLSILFPWVNSKWKNIKSKSNQKRKWCGRSKLGLWALRWTWCLAVQNILYQDGPKQIRSIRFTIHLIKALDVGVVVNNFFKIMFGCFVMCQNFHKMSMLTRVHKILMRRSCGS